MDLSKKPEKVFLRLEVCDLRILYENKRGIWHPVRRRENALYCLTHRAQQVTRESAGVDGGLGSAATSHHSLGYEPAVYGLQVRVPTFPSLLGQGQKRPREKSHSTTRDEDGDSTYRGGRKVMVESCSLAE